MSKRTDERSGMKRTDDAEFLRRAAELAAKGLGHTRPNPAVGAVIVRGGKIIGEGWHKKAGGDHAEVAAIKNAACRGESAADATIYVTLEPCSKPGRVGACTDAIVAAGIKRVVYAIADPNPTNRGKAKRALAKRGIACELFKGDREVSAACRRLISDFRKYVLTGLPYVTVKLAMSMDGKICDNWGDSNWISCAASRDRTNELRSRVDAIMVRIRISSASSSRRAGSCQRRRRCLRTARIRRSYSTTRRRRSGNSARWA